MTSHGLVESDPAVWPETTKRQLAAVLDLCVRERLHPETPAAIRWTVTLPGSWGEGFPTREAAEAAILERANEVTT